jgi:hypothetical protein
MSPAKLCRRDPAAQHFQTSIRRSLRKAKNRDIFGAHRERAGVEGGLPHHLWLRSPNVGVKSVAFRPVCVRGKLIAPWELLQ